MGNRGRHSAAELAIVKPGALESLARPKPPDELTTDEADEWRKIVNVMPADECTQDCFPAIIQLCRHTVNARRLADLKERCQESNDVAHALEIMRQETEQTRIILSLMTKLRLSPQSRYDRKKIRPTAGAKKPWDFEA